MKLYVDGATTETCFILGNYTSITPSELKTTGNVGEYHALIRGLTEAKNRGLKKLEIFSDSELMVNQLKLGQNGMPIYSCKNERLASLRRIVIDLLETFEHYTISWIPREKNLAGKILEQRYNQRRKHANT
jgi:ribonuclease HI